MLRRGARGVVRRLPRPGLTDVWPLRRLVPVSREFGYDRGLPVDRYYIERFLAEHAQLVAGRVLEVGDDAYTRRFGGERVTSSDVLNIDAAIPGTTVVADLADAAHLPSESYDCLVVTQTLHLVYDLPAAVATLHRVLRPGGTLLLTVPGISPVSTDRWADTWYWALTPHAARRLFVEEFVGGEVEVTAHGNVLAAVAFLEGLAADELRPARARRGRPPVPGAGDRAGGPRVRLTGRSLRRGPGAWRLLDALAGARRHTDTGAVALTFDDGPQPGSTDRVLDVLAALDVRADLLLRGTQRRAAPRPGPPGPGRGPRRGLATATATPTRRPRRCGVLAEDYARGRAAVEDALGERVTLFRPPRGWLGPAPRGAAAVRRTPPWLWTWTRGTGTPTRSARGRGRGRRRRPGDVVLLHDWVEQPWDARALDRSSTVEAMPAVVAAVRARGLRFAALDG